MLWLWLNFVSQAGFLALGSQVTLTLTTTYLFVVSSSLYSRIYHPDVLGRERIGLFQLGKLWGTIVDVSAICYLCIVFVLAW